VIHRTRGSSKEPAATANPNRALAEALRFGLGTPASPSGPSPEAALRGIENLVIAYSTDAVVKPGTSTAPAREVPNQHLAPVRGPDPSQGPHVVEPGSPHAESFGGLVGTERGVGGDEVARSSRRHTAETEIIGTRLVRAAQAFGWSASVIAVMLRLPSGSRCTSKL
jgi:hypothetical protein